MIAIDEKKAIKSGLTFNEVFFLRGLMEGYKDKVHIVNVDLLKNRKLISDEAEITDVGKTLVGKIFCDVSRRPIVLPREAEVQDLSEKFRELFPKGVKSGGYAVRSNIKNISHKMRLFKSEWPQYTDEQILKATEKYVKEKEREGYAFMKTAEYLIMKDRNSALASLIDATIEGADDTTTWGRRI